MYKAKKTKEKDIAARKKRLNGRVSEHTFSDYLNGKRVIIVGPAGYLQGQDKGKYINGFDVVVRINHAIPIKYPNDYGNRTDVLYHILSHRAKNGQRGKQILERREIIEWRDNKLKFLVSRHGLTSHRIDQMKSVIGGLVAWLAMRESFCRSVKNKVRSTPNTGVMGIMHLLLFPIESLTVIGFDFYASGVYNGYGDIREGEAPNVINSRWHENAPQIKFLANLKKTETRLRFDKVLEEICKSK